MNEMDNNILKPEPTNLSKADISIMAEKISEMFK